jgi:hypothetical protein
MYERGRRDAEADALDENYYHYYYDYRLAYDEVLRSRRRSQRQRILARAGRTLVWLLPVVLILGGGGYAAYTSLDPLHNLAASMPTPTRTPRPTLVPPTPIPAATPTPELALRADGFAVISGTDGAKLRARSGPGTDQTIVARFSEGQRVRIVEGPQDASGLTWWRIEADNQRGWAAAAYLKPVPPE